MRLDLNYYFYDSKKRLSVKWSKKSLNELLIEKQKVKELLHLMYVELAAIEDETATLESDFIYIEEIICNYRTIHARIYDAIVRKRRKCCNNFSNVAINHGGVYCTCDDYCFGFKYHKLISGVTL